MNTLQEIFTKYVGTSFARQMALADSMAEDTWEADLEAGTLNLGSHQYSAQILGSHAIAQNTWLWAWGNEQAGFPKNSLEVAHRIRDFGITNRIPELEERIINMENIDPHMLAMACTGIEPNTCYYPGAYDGGTAFLVITNPTQEILAPVKPERVSTVIMHVISTFEVNHRNFLDNFLTQQGFEIIENHGKTVGKRDDGSVTVRFNASGLIEEVTGDIQPRKEKKSWWRL